MRTIVDSARWTAWVFEFGALRSREHRLLAIREAKLPAWTGPDGWTHWAFPDGRDYQIRGDVLARYEGQPRPPSPGPCPWVIGQVDPPVLHALRSPDPLPLLWWAAPLPALSSPPASPARGASAALWDPPPRPEPHPEPRWVPAAVEPPPLPAAPARPLPARPPPALPPSPGARRPVRGTDLSDLGL